MRAVCVAVAAVSLTTPLAAANDIVPAGTLRVAFTSTNPVQAVVDAKTGEIRGPSAELARELAKRLGVRVEIRPLADVPDVIDSVRNDQADIGFVAYDPVRALQVDFSQGYTLAHNTFVVTTNSPIRSFAEIDQPGTRIGVSASDAGALHLSRRLKYAEIRPNPGGDIAAGLKWLAQGDIVAYAANRQRLTQIASRTIGLRLLSDNFYAAEQAIAVKKGNVKLLEAVDKCIDEARDSGLIAATIARAGLVGVDVAPKTARTTPTPGIPPPPG